jgi:hypothetical protein
MKKIVMIFGFILGAILCANAIYMMNMMRSDPNFKGNDVIGYAAMVVVFSLIYFGVRNYRNKYLDGTISFGKAFKTGALIALVASTLYVAVGLAYYYLFAPDFLDHYINYVLKNTPADKLADKTVEMANYKKMYKNPLFAILISYSEVLPIGLVVALVSALLLKRKSKKAEAYATS